MFNVGSSFVSHNGELSCFKYRQLPLLEIIPASTAFLINTFLKEAISLYEDRINYKEAIISRSGNKLHIEMHYTLKQSNEEKSLGITYNNLTNSLS